MDPEIPVVSVVDLGVIREVDVKAEGGIRVTMTPTFSGCPALDVMRKEVARKVRSLGHDEVQVLLEYHPPWTTDDLTDRGREKLREFGLTPPAEHGGNVALVLDGPRACPRCGSRETELKNSFGSTLCRSLHYCKDCREPFQAIKPL